jgi:membrane associated rhomboid family serine protease
VYSAPPLTPVVKKLIIALFAAFVVQLLLEFFGVHEFSHLALDPVHLGLLTPVQMFTYVFVQDADGLGGFLISLVFMWLIVSDFERAFGRKHTIELIIVGTLGGSLATVLMAFVMPLRGFLLHGSFPIAYAGMAASAQIMRGRTMMLFGVLPLTTRQFAIGLIVLPLLLFLISRNHLLLAAMYGSLLAGGGYVKYMARTPRRPTPPSKRPGGTRFRVLRGGGGGGGSGSDGDGDRPKWLN